MIKKIYFELYKNFKIIFRNISSISLLILGPLLLILLIGFAFSGTEVHSIKIGVKASDYESLQPFLDNFTGIGEIEKYEKIDPCINDMRQEKIHICLEFSDGFSDQDEFNQGHIAFYFDNTRKILSNEIVDGISDFLGLTTEKISIESAQTIFKNIETLVVFLDRRNNDILVLINESEKMKSDILQRKERLIEIREDFLPKYEKIKKLQKSIKNISKDVDSSYMSFDSDIDNFKDKVNEIENSIEEVLEVANIPNYYVYEINKTFFITTNKTYLNLNNFSYEKINLSIINITNHEFVIPPVNYSVILNETRKIDYSSLPIDESFNFAMISFKQGINTFEDSIDSFDENITRYYELLNEQKLEFDEIIYQIDNVKILLDEEIDATDTYIKTIDESVIKITELRETLSTNLEKLSELNPAIAEKLIKPILQSFEPVQPGIENIKLSYPTLLTLVIVFISLLFSNIVTLSELNSKAYLRNLIAPVNDLIYVIGLIFTNLLVILFQVIILLMVAQFRFGIDVFSNFWSIMFIVFLLSLIFVFFGMAIAYYFSNEQSSILTATFVSLAFFLFSDIVTPLEAMPKHATLIANNSPFVISQAIFKKIIIYDLPLYMSMSSIYKLIIYALLSLVLLIIVSKWKNRTRI